MKLFVAYIIFFSGVLGWAGASGDHDTSPPQNQGRAGGAPGAGRSESCGIAPGEIAAIANGQRQNLGPVITFLTSPACSGIVRLEVAKMEIANGVEFNTMPFRLDQAAKTFSLNSMQSAKKLDAYLRRQVPQIMGDHAFSVQEQIPLVAQFALLSQSTGMWALGNILKEEIVATNGSNTEPGKKDGSAEEKAANLILLGAGEKAVVSELAGMIEEMALLSQADALGKILRGLASAASVEGALVPVFNSAANAFQNGVSKGNKNFNLDQRRSLTSAGLDGAREALQGNSLMNPGIHDLNEAFKTLLKGRDVQELSMKNLWKQIVKTLSLTPLLTNLADLIATSITPQVAFLQEKERKLLVQASQNYPPLAFAIEKNCLDAWSREWDALHQGAISTEEFNLKRDRFFKPMVNELLEVESVALDEAWLKAALHRGLVSDDRIEKRFPSFVLSLLERREKSMATVEKEPDLESAIGVFSEDMAVLWGLSRVYIPALKKWIVKYED